MFRLAAFLVLTCASLLAQDSKRAGIIRGVVLDATDQPVEDARVKANFTGGFSGIVPTASTDKSGHFVIRRLAWGEWYVTAAKEQEGYPDESNAFYSGFGSILATVDLGADNPQQFVTVHLGEKAGSISGTIADAETGKPVEPCARLQWKNVPSISWSGYGLIKSKFYLLVPADTDITLMIWAWGYEPWVYKNDDGVDALRVHASDQLKLQVRLTPNHEKARQPTDEELKKMHESISAFGCADLPPLR
jgi:Carboxypeptidase regulatory-like domain